MNFTQAVSVGLTKLFCFQGRTSRSEFWWFVLFLTIVSFILRLPLFFLSPDSIFYLSYDAITSLVVGIVGIAIATRRLHDIDKSGWWQLLNLIPLIGFIVLLCWFCEKGTDGENRFGADSL
ncbi:DUF805 domain-containing protein [Campylobacter helveticus]|uniref:DUF805 domain-containing protein n=1 Tax=Campylobacter helveticus TaxID=28898 RepID=UPI001111BED2|nr:DUF805 domain-containing protein [Campylobacter helveticus]TNB55062.1 DUF805 domain-containing protein [Campylobacter helveticus]TNH33707.1 DUF805 domain-containing protein [Campylobacter helveticus]